MEGSFLKTAKDYKLQHLNI